MIFIWLVFVLVGIYYFREWLHRRKSPPGPWPVPFLGNLVQLGIAGTQPHLAFSNLAKQYNSDIVRLKLGGKECVVLSSYEAISEVLSHPSALGRALEGAFYDRNGGGDHRYGIGFKEGKPWEQRKAWFVRTLRDFGFGKSGEMEAATLEVIDEFLNKIKKQLPTSGEGIVKMEHLFPFPVFKILWKMIAGECTKEDEVMVEELLIKNDLMFKNGRFGISLISVFPFVKYILPGWSGFSVQMDFFANARKAARELFEKISSNMKGTGNGKKPTNLTEAYISKMQSGEEPSEFNEKDYEVLFMDIMQAGADTTGSFLESCCIFAILHPETQAKVYKEIQENIPKGQNAAYSDLKKMIYTQAWFMEVHRCAYTAVIFPPRRAFTDLTYKNYLIKKDSTIFTNTYGAFINKRFGVDPETFRPERFIKENGELNENKKYIFPFSFGKRNCPGESLAEVTYFLFFVMILKKYELLTVAGRTPPRSEMHISISSRPYPFEMWLKKRMN